MDASQRMLTARLDGRDTEIEFRSVSLAEILPNEDNP
jgi:hypothetical protein